MNDKDVGGNIFMKDKDIAHAGEGGTSLSTVKPSSVAVFSFRQMMPPGLRPAMQRFMKGTKSSSVSWPITH